MMFRTLCLCLLILSGLFITTTSSHDIVCYIREELIPTGDANATERNEFLSSLPDEKCTRYIFLVENFSRRGIEGYLEYLPTFKERKPKAELGIMISRYTKYYLAMYGFKFAELYFTGIHFYWDERSGNPYTASQRKELVEHTRRKYSNLKMTVSQAVECIPRFSEPLDTSKVAMDVDLTIVHVKTFKDMVPKFLEDPEMCVRPLLALGIPKEKIVIGLQEVTGDRGRNLAQMKENCHDEPVREILTDISTKLSCMVKFTSLQGVMVWSISTDDYTGNVCKMGKYPFIEYYQNANFQSCTAFKKSAQK